MAEAILTSWRFDFHLIGLLGLAVFLYVRGWVRLHRQSPHRYTVERLASYLGGLTALFIALASPLDAFGNLLLMAHMVQHLILIMVAPPLILLGQPVLPILRGLPADVFREGLGPFLGWHGLQRLARRLTHPVVCWLAMAASVLFWHMPRWYDLGLTSAGWHGVEHACFFYSALLFWSPVIGLWPNRPHWPQWLAIPYLVLADAVNTALSAWLVFSSHVVYQTYAAAPRIAGMSALEDQSTAGAIMWVPGSIAYLIPALILTMRAIQGSRAKSQLIRIKPATRAAARQPWDLLRLPTIGLILRHRWFRPAFQGVLFAVAAAVVIDGLRGPQIAPLNLAGTLPWTYWRGFTVIAVLAAGNLFCMGCPFTLVRGSFLGGKLRWPKALRSKWLAIALLALYLWANEVFSLWNSPWWTAWIVIGYFVAALLINGLFQGASFCKYVCPIGQFHFVNTLVSPLEVKVRSSAVCGSCKTEDCIGGNDRNRGCELYLFQPMKAGNFDCTFCLDCVQSCPHDNVGLIVSTPGIAITEDRRGSGIGRLSERTDAAALVWVMIFGSLVTAAAMVDPVMSWMHAVYRYFGLHTMLPVTTGFFAAGIMAAPLLLWWLLPRARAFAFPLIPLGTAMWVAHFSFHLVTGWRSIVPAATRFLHLSANTMAGSAEVPEWFPGIQLLVLGCGLVLSVYLIWKTARRVTESVGRAVRLLMPWAAFAIGIYAASVWILFQPMQMRGMVM